MNDFSVSTFVQLYHSLYCYSCELSVYVDRSSYILWGFNGGTSLEFPPSVRNNKTNLTVYYKWAHNTEALAAVSLL